MSEQAKREWCLRHTFIRTFIINILAVRLFALVLIPSISIYGFNKNFKESFVFFSTYRLRVPSET